MSFLRFVLTGILVITFISANSLAKSINGPKENDLLPLENDPIPSLSDQNVVATYYKITLAPNFASGNFTFTGESSINITVSTKSPIKTIVLHAKNLIFDKNFTRLDTEDKKLKPSNPTIRHEEDYLILDFPTAIANGNYALKLKYNGTLNDDFNGFYKTSYTNEDKKEVWLVATNFKPGQARQAFPCFDEPSLRSRFEISINHWKNNSAISNMPTKNFIPDEKDNSKVYTNFNVTPPMAPYQVAFVISSLGKIENKNKTFNIWARKDLLQKNKFALEIGQKEYEHLKNYIEIDHGVPKIENVAVPNLTTDANENWGLVTFSEKSLLIDEKETSTNVKQNIATLMSRKLTNQWFGNLVSPLSWDDSWINEGLANYFQYFITDKVEPEWRLMDQFVIKNLQEIAFVADDKKNQHAIHTNHTNLPDIELFDSISSSKSGSVLRMFSHIITESKFQSGLKEYLKRTKYGAGSKSYLFDALITVAKDSVPEIRLQDAFTTWSDQSGYPVVTATRDYKTNVVTFNQRRYLSEKESSETSQERWWIPINGATQADANFNNTKPELWIKPTSPMKTDQFDLKNDQWVIFNNKQTGYYRVNYDLTNWKLISNYLQTKNYTKIDVINRAQLLDDSFNLVKSKDLKDYGVFLNISSYLKQEDDYVPWYAAFRAFEFFENALVNTKKYDVFKLYILRLLEKLDKTVGYFESDKDAHLTRLNRINLIKWSCKMGSDSCSKEMHKRLIQHVEGKNKISADLRSVVLCAGIRTANETIWKKTFKAYEISKNEAERSAILEGLGCSSDKKIVNSYLAKILEPKLKISGKDVIKAVYLGSDVGVELAFDFIEKNYKTIMKNDGNSTILSCLYDIASRMNTKAQADKLEGFIKSLSASNNELADALKKNALVSVKKNVQWVKEHEGRIVEFLEDQKLLEDMTTTTTTTSPNSTTSSSNSSSITPPITSSTEQSITSSTTQSTTSSTTQSTTSSTTQSTTSSTTQPATSSTTQSTTSSTTQCTTSSTTQSVTSSITSPTASSSKTSPDTSSITSSETSSTTPSTSVTLPGEPEPNPPVELPNTGANSSPKISIPTFPLTIFFAVIVRFLSQTL